MEIKNFAELIDKVKGMPEMKRMVIAAAGEVLQSLFGYSR